MTERRAKSRSRGHDAAEHRFVTPDGVVVFLEESHTLPLVDFELCLRTGTTFDPPGKEGLTRIVWRALRMGTKHLSSREVEDGIARLGARLGMEVSSSSVRIRAVVIRRNLEPFLELLATLLREPAFRPADLAQAKRETYADMISLRDNDRALAGRHLRRLLFADHPYGRSVVGSRTTVGAIRRDDVRENHETHLCGKNLIFGFAGDLTRQDLETLLARHFSDLPRGRPPRMRLPAPQIARGRRIRIIDKPERTQTQMVMGTLGSKVGDRHHDALSVASTAFGGTLTSPLWLEVREKRGWSYGAASRLGADRAREAFTVHTFPTAEHTVECAALELSLLDHFVAHGVSAAEHRLAKRYLINGHCFDLDTPGKRLEVKVDHELFGLPADHLATYERRVRGVTRAASAEAVRARLSSRDMVIAVVATAKDVADGLAALPGVTDIDVVRYDRA